MRFNCKGIHEHASDYLDGRLSLWQRVQFRFHVFICGPCARFVQQFKATIATLRQLPTNEPDSDDVEAQVAKLRALRNSSKT